MSNEVQKFFDQMGADYDASIERCVPRYREMLARLLSYAPHGEGNIRILELGCGTGNLTSLIAARWPQAHLTLVDVSAELLDRCRSRMGGSQAEYVCADFRDVRFADGQFDLAFSSIAIHHLESDEKRRLFRRLADSLKPKGVFMFADQFAGATAELYEKHMRAWEEATLQAGVSLDEWRRWMAHQTAHDFHEPLFAQMRWLLDSGFADVDCVWRDLLWAIVFARRETS